MIKPRKLLTTLKIEDSTPPYNVPAIKRAPNVLKND